MNPQRLLSPEEIALQRGVEPPWLRLPDRARLFAGRAERLRALCDGHPMQPYLRLLGELAQAQHHALQQPVALRLPEAAQLQRSAEHLMPAVPVHGWEREPVWRDDLQRVLDELSTHLDGEAAATVTRLRQASTDWLEDQANRILNDRELGLDRGAAIFIAAALQVYWTRLVLALGEGVFGRIATAGLCPCCGSRPVASILRPGQGGMQRYLHCRLCAAEWYMVRIKCPTCEANGRIEYFHVEGGSEAVKAEACGDCRTYTKILHSDLDEAVDPVADDVASLQLDFVIADSTDFLRAGINFALFPGDDPGGEAAPACAEPAAGQPAEHGWREVRR